MDQVNLLLLPWKLAGQNLFGDRNLLLNWLCNGKETDINNYVVQIDSSCSSVLHTKGGIWSKLFDSIMTGFLHHFNEE